MSMTKPSASDPSPPDIYTVRAKFLRWSALRVLKFCRLLAFGRKHEAARISGGMNDAQIDGLLTIWPVNSLVEALAALERQGKQLANTIGPEFRLHLERIIAHFRDDPSDQARARLAWIERMGRGSLDRAADRLTRLIGRRIEAFDQPETINHLNRRQCQSRPQALRDERQLERLLLAKGRRLLLQDMLGCIIQTLAAQRPQTEAEPSRADLSQRQMRLDLEKTVDQLIQSSHNLAQLHRNPPNPTTPRPNGQRGQGCWTMLHSNSSLVNFELIFPNQAFSGWS